MSFETDEQKQAYVANLVDERAYCQTYGKTDRVKAIDAELARVTGTAAPRAKKAAKRA